MRSTIWVRLGPGPGVLSKIIGTLYVDQEVGKHVATLSPVIQDTLSTRSKFFAMCGEMAMKP